MWGVKKCDSCDNKEKNNYDRYKEKIALEKIKLHRNYVCVILVSIIVWLIATGTYADTSFPALVSFASTIASIILSVIAIIMSISGENKTNAIKNDLAETARKLDLVSDRINNEANDTNKDIKELISELERQVKILQGKIDKVPEKVAEGVKYKTTNKTYSNVNSRTNNRVEWGNNGEKR